jgi:hypothetical protein
MTTGGCRPRWRSTRKRRLALRWPSSTRPEKSYLRPVREDFEAKNKQLLDEMPRFSGSRLDYFQPSFESLIRAQVRCYSEMDKIFGDLSQQLEKPGHSDEQRELENETKLSEL